MFFGEQFNRSEEKNETYRSSYTFNCRLLLYDDITRYDVEQIREDDEPIWHSSLFHRAPVSIVVDATWRRNCLWIKVFGV